ncbi:MAG: C-type lectin domain-containing protein [Sandaracinaceae bacterium]
MVDEDGGCPVVQYMGHAYQFCTTRERWDQAEVSCTRDGYHLVTIDDRAENDFVRDEARSRRDEDWWIGYTDDRMEGTFEWVSGSTSTFTNWALGQPDNSGFNADCTEMINGTLSPGVRGEWNDATCNTNQSYVCESP